MIDSDDLCLLLFFILCFSPVTNVKRVNAPTRANFRLLLQRQEMEENRRREELRAQQQQRFVTSSGVVQHKPRESVYTGRQIVTEVPAQILKVCVRFINDLILSFAT